MFDHLHDNPPAPFNPDFRPGFKEAVEKAYGEYCELPDSPVGNGPEAREIRMAKHRELCAELAPQFPSLREMKHFSDEP